MNARGVEAVLLAAAAAAQVPVVVLLPAPLAATVGSAIAAVCPDAAIATGTLAEVLEAADRSRVLVVDEWQAWRLAQQERLAALAAAAALPADCRDPAGRWFLPWRLRYVAAVAVNVPLRTGSWTLEALALEPLLHDRLGLCAPDTDAAPWLASMAECLQRSGNEREGYALWTTLDARAGRYCASYAQMLEGLHSGALLAAVLPAPLATALGRSHAIAELGAPPPAARLGIAVGKGSGLAAATAAAGALLAASGNAAFLERSGLEAAVPGRGTFDGPRAAQWLRHFDAEVRGRGRGVERLADSLDLVFLGLSAATVATIWLVARRRARAAGRSA